MQNENGLARLERGHSSDCAGIRHQFRMRARAPVVRPKLRHHQNWNCPFMTLVSLKRRALYHTPIPRRNTFFEPLFFKPVPPDIDQTMVNALVTHAEEIASQENVKNLKDPLYAILVGLKDEWEEREGKKPEAERKPFPYNSENYFTFPFAQWIKDNAERLVKAWEPLTRDLLKAANCYCWSFPESDFAGIIDKYFPKPYNWAA